MNKNTVSRRYAKALFDLAVEEGRFDEVGRELSQVRAALESDAELAEALRDPVTGRAQKERLADALAGALGLSPLVANTLRLMAQRNRLEEAPLVERIYGEFADERAGRVRARVTTPRPIDDATAARLAASLSAATRREVVVDRAVDPSLLGGVVAQVGSMVYDGSLKTQLEALKRQLQS